MHNRRCFHRFGWVALTVFLEITAGLGIASGAEDEGRAFSKFVDARGNISLPEGFATAFVSLGSIAVAPKAGADVAELHATYTRDADLRAFQREGHFPDGAVLVKEVRATQAEDLPTGHTRFAAGVKVWFVMIKDSKNRFPDNALWGDGWGWALFNGKDPKKQVATDYETDCRSCHIPARKTDWVYTQCYPLLQKQEAADAKTSEADVGTKPDLVAKFPQWKEALQLQGNAERGRKYFESKVLNTSMTCASCHSFDRRDAPSLDADGLRRAGSSVYGAAHRTNIKKSGTNLVALGGNVCVIHFMKGDEPGMNAQELADLDRFLKTGGGADHPSAKNIEYAALN